MGKLAGLAAREGSEAATVLARTSGAMNAGANWVDTAAVVNTAVDLGQHWNAMTPGQRAETGLQLAFWAGMRGVSARNTGQGLDGYSFRQQMNHAMLETGAAVKPNPALGAHDVSTVPQRNSSGAITDIQVQYGSQASKAVIDIHTAAARDLVNTAGPDGALRRAITGKGWQPGTQGEKVMVEVAKHQTLMEHYDQALQSKSLSAQDRQTLTELRASVKEALSTHSAELAKIEANPALGREPAENDGVIDVKHKKTAKAQAEKQPAAEEVSKKEAAAEVKERMLGEGGTQIDSKTLVSRENFYSIDVENPDPGGRPGQLHVHDNSKVSHGPKYLYDFETGKFEGAPAGLARQLAKDPKVATAIIMAKNILGVN